jgi:hypothetical protein
MIQYEVQLNQGNEALQTGKTITANEVLLTADEKALAREIHHQNSLIPEDVAAAVLGYFGKAAVQLMAMGFAIQFKNGQDVLMRIYPDVHLKGGNINMERAKQLLRTTTLRSSEIAYQVGYRDPHYFSFMFKKTQGMPPKEYCAKRARQIEE